MCNRETGDCYCTTKGVTGKNCSKCEPKYYGDPENNQLCYCEFFGDCNNVLNEETNRIILSIILS